MNAPYSLHGTKKNCIIFDIAYFCTKTKKFVYIKTWRNGVQQHHANVKFDNLSNGKETLFMLSVCLKFNNNNNNNNSDEKEGERGRMILTYKDDASGRLKQIKICNIFDNEYQTLRLGCYTRAQQQKNQHCFD